MSRPTLYLTNLSSWQRTPGHADPGRCYAAMAKPPRVALRDGKCGLAAPLRDDLGAVMSGRMTHEAYFEACRRVFKHRRMLNQLSPGTLWAKPSDRRLVCDGDTLICMCARPGSPRRRHRCHLEEFAPELLAAGWEVVLYGQPSAVWTGPDLPTTPAQRLLFGGGT